MNQLLKKLTTATLTGAIALASIASPVFTWAAGNNETQKTVENRKPTGLFKHGPITQKPDVDIKNIPDAEEIASVGSAGYANAEWDKYSSNYVYNQLNKDEKKVWDALEEVSNSILNGNKDLELTVEYSDGFTCYYSEDMLFEAPASFSGEKGVSLLTGLYYLFFYTNPQFYFLDTAVWVFEDGDGCIVVPLVAEGFENGAKRAKITKELKDKADSLIAEATVYQTDLEKVQYFHDQICNMVEYDYDAYNKDGGAYDQTAYSTFFTDKTVCAGYSTAFELLCNGAGIDCFAVTSYDEIDGGHEWNRVMIDDNWYNIDLTWDDGGYNEDGTYSGYDMNYFYFLKSDEYWDTIEDDPENAKAHVEEELWDGLLMDCVLDSTYGESKSDYYTDKGKLPEVSEISTSPTVTFVKTGSKYQVLISGGDKNAWYYYTTDGTTPTANYYRCNKYSGAFAVNSPGKVKVVTYVPGKLKNTSYKTVNDTIAVPTIKSAKNVKGYKLKVSYKKASGAVGYQVQYALNKAFTKSAKTVTTSKTSYTTKKLKKNKTYYVRVRSYKKIGTQKIYSEFSSVKKVKIKK